MSFALKEISEYSAHNQRGVVTVKVYLDKNSEMIDDYKEKILDAMEANAKLYSLSNLKRQMKTRNRTCI